MKAYEKRCRRKFAKLAALNKLQDAGGDQAIVAGQAKRAMPDTWIRRTGNSKGYWKAREARKAARGLGD